MMARRSLHRLRHGAGFVDRLRRTRTIKADSRRWGWKPAASSSTRRERSAGGTAQCTARPASSSKMVYEERKGRPSKQYDAVDAESTCTTSWKTAVFETEERRDRGSQAAVSSLETERASYHEEEIRIRSMGDHFAGVWQSNHVLRH